VGKTQNINVTILPDTYIYLRTRSTETGLSLHDLMERCVTEYRLHHPEEEPLPEVVQAWRVLMQHSLGRGRKPGVRLPRRPQAEVDHA